MNHRTFAILTILLLPGILFAQAEREKVVVTKQALEIHKKSFVFDGHNDLPWAIRTKGSLSFERLDISKPQPELHTDIKRLRKGNVGAQFWSVYVPSETMKKGTSLADTVQQINLVKTMVKRYPDTFQLALTFKDIKAARKANKIASLIGIEGGHSIENSIQNLRRLHEIGARYMTLTHSDTLDWADSATDDPRHQGLSRFGEEIVLEMNKLGMLVDLSHVSVETMNDALRVSKAPVIFSHSSARAVADHVRNVPDNVLKKVKANGGVVMINFFSGFVEPESARLMSKMFDVSRELREKFPEEEDYQRERLRWRKANPILPGSVHDIVDHIDHVVKVAGIDHVGIGSDYDGVSSVPLQLEDVSTYPVLTQALLDRGYTEQQIHKIMSGNILRVYEKAESVSEQLKK